MNLRLLILSLLTTSAIVLSGCMESTLTVEVNPDGSGTITHVNLVDQNVYTMMTMDENGQPQPGTDPFVNPEGEAQAKADAAKFGQGVTFVSLEALTQGAKRGSVTTYTFTDVTKLTLTFSDAMENSAQEQSEELDSLKEEEEPIKIAFTPGAPATLTFTLPELDSNGKAPDQPEEPDLTDEEIMQMQQMAPMFAGMQFTMELKVKGTITETNATYLEDDSIIFMQMDVGEIMGSPEGMKKLQSLQGEDDQQKVIQELQGVDGLRFEPERVVTVSFN